MDWITVTQYYEVSLFTNRVIESWCIKHLCYKLANFLTILFSQHAPQGYHVSHYLHNVIILAKKFKYPHPVI